MDTIGDRLCGKKAKAIYLLLAAACLLLTMLGGRELWTQESRWADIVTGMLTRQDYLHPYLGNTNYYDKPLLSYWLIAALTQLSGQLSLFVLRLPSALAGLLAIWSIYRIGVQLKNRQLGILAGWLLLTTFYFIFWARTSSADMLNLAGTLFAVSWYFDTKENPNFFNYAIFFGILSLTSLCKGLIGAVVPLLVIFSHVIQNKAWKDHLRFSFLLGMIPGAIIYLLPFWASTHFGGNEYVENGLYLVYRENILRYFQPFDHKGPIYTYLIYLPIYLLPWTFFFIPTLLTLRARWNELSSNSKSIALSVLLLFLFFTLSGSRRNYYVLPMVPFAILMIAEWILSGEKFLSKSYVWTGKLIIGFFILFFLNFDIAQPIYYSQGGVKNFSSILKKEISQTRPWSQWQVVLLDPENKVRFYLAGASIVDISKDTLQKILPQLQQKQNGIIIITRKELQPKLQPLLLNYRIVETKPNLGERLLRIKNENSPIAFIPKELTAAQVKTHDSEALVL